MSNQEMYQAISDTLTMLLSEVNKMKFYLKLALGTLKRIRSFIHHILFQQSFLLPYILLLEILDKVLL